MATQVESSHNSRGFTSRKSRPRGGKLALLLAAKIARQIGLPATWPNLQTITLALESEVSLSQAKIEQVAEMFVRAAREHTSKFSGYSCPTACEQYEIERGNTLNRFWFEDARWRGKYAYSEFLDKLRNATGVA